MITYLVVTLSSEFTSRKLEHYHKKACKLFVVFFSAMKEKKKKKKKVYHLAGNIFSWSIKYALEYHYILFAFSTSFSLKALRIFVMSVLAGA